MPEAEAQLDAVDHLFDDGRRIDRALEERARREATPAGLVAWEGRPVDEQHLCSCRGELDRRGRSRRAAADHDGVEALHTGEATILPPGVCPSGQRERAVNPSAQPTEVRILPPPSSSSWGRSNMSSPSGYVRRPSDEGSGNTSRNQCDPWNVLLLTYPLVGRFGQRVSRWL